MKRGTIKIISEKSKVSAPFVSQILSGKRSPRWPKAKKLAEATGTTPDLWMEGPHEKIRKVLEEMEGE